MKNVIRRLNHAVLYVRDAIISAKFYVDVLGFEIVQTMGEGAVFLSTPKSANDHDLGLFSIGDHQAAFGSGGRSVGLYHLAWEVDTLADLVDLRDRLIAVDALHGASNHGASRSLYAKDPDGIEFEVMWEVPMHLLDPEIDVFGVAPLDIDADIARFGRELSRNH